MEASLGISRQTYATIKRGLFWTFIYKLVGNALLLRRWNPNV